MQKKNPSDLLRCQLTGATVRRQMVKKRDYVFFILFIV